MPKLKSENVPVLVVDGVVKLPPEAKGAVVVGGSNATAYAAYYSARAGVRAAIHHDCGIGRDEGGGKWSALGRPAWHGYGGRSDGQRPGPATPQTCSTRGIISRVNKLRGHVWRRDPVTPSHKPWSY